MSDPIKILLVEDDPDFVILFKDILQNSDFSEAFLIVASSLTEALNYRKNASEISLIILDLGLPDSQGIDTLRMMRKHFPGCAVNVLTASYDKQTAIQSLREGAQNFLVKGYFHSNELDRVIINSIEQHSVVTKLSDINELLKQSEQKYKLLFENNPMPMWVIDKSSLKFLDVNQAAINHYGYSREEFLSVTSVEIRPEEDRKKYVEFHRSRTGGPQHAGLWKHRRKDGTIIDVEITLHDTVLDDKKARLILANDVTEKLKAEEALRHREEMLSSIYDTTADIIFVLEVEQGERYKFSSVNKAFQVTTGVPFEMVVGKYVNEIIPQPSLDMVLTRYTEAIRGKKIERWEETTDYPKGRLTGVVSIAPHFDEAGNCIRLVGTVHDITERKKAEDKIIQSEEQYKDLVENITDLICTHDLDGWILSANKAAEKIVGYNFNSEKKWNIKDILSPDKKAAYNEYIDLIKKQGHAEGFMKVRTGKGEIRIWEYQNTLKTDGVNIPIIRGYARDITERKKAEEEIKASHKELRELTAYLQTIREEERTHLAREVHDVLGQQITGLKIDMTWLGKKITSKDTSVEERFAGMLSLADEMVKTIRKIASELRPGILDDLGLIPALEWQSSEFEKRTGIKCLFSSNDSLPDLAKINATGIFRIYQETLTNVARHAGATKVDVAVSCRDDTITLSVADNGKGLDAAEMKLKKTLGIVGMKERAAMMKGNLTVQPRNEGGTVVILSVPVQNNNEV